MFPRTEVPQKAHIHLPGGRSRHGPRGPHHLRRQPQRSARGRLQARSALPSQVAPAGFFPWPTQSPRLCFFPWQPLRNSRKEVSMSLPSSPYGLSRPLDVVLCIRHGGVPGSERELGAQVREVHGERFSAAWHPTVDFKPFFWSRWGADRIAC